MAKKKSDSTITAVYGHVLLLAVGVVAGSILYSFGRDVYEWMKKQGKYPPPSQALPPFD